MVKKLFILLVVLGMMFSTALVFAADPEEAEESTIQSVDIQDHGFMMRYTDGRLNQWDLIAPVAVYYTSMMLPEVDESGIPILLADGRENIVNTVVSLDLWGLHPDTGNIDHLINVPLDELHAMATAATGPGEIVSALGYQVGYAPDFGGWYWVSAPPDAEGNVYMFKWQE